MAAINLHFPEGDQYALSFGVSFGGSSASSVYGTLAQCPRFQVRTLKRQRGMQCSEIPNRSRSSDHHRNCVCCRAQHCRCSVGRMVGAGYRRLCRWRAHRERVRTALLRIWLRLWVLFRYGYPAYYRYGYPAYYSYGYYAPRPYYPPLLRTAALLPLVNWVRPLFAFLSAWRTVNPGGRPVSTSREQFGAAAAVPAADPPPGGISKRLQRISRTCPPPGSQR